MKRTNGQRTLRAILVGCLVVAGLFAAPQPVQAASVIHVNTTADELNSTSNGKCSLREAVIAANENRAVGGCPAGGSGTDTIIIPRNPDANTPYGLTRETPTGGEDLARTGDLDIRDSLIITGAGANQTTVAAAYPVQDNKDRVFHLIQLSNKLVKIQNLRITGGTGVDHGGGVFNQGSRLILEDVEVSGNHAEFTGGGVSSQPSKYHPSLTILNSWITVNTSSHAGGGVYSNGNMVIERSLISSNSASLTGGGVDFNAALNYSGTVTNTTISNNISPAGSGVYVPGLLAISSSTIYDNTGGIGLLVETNGRVNLKNTIVAGHGDPNCGGPGAIASLGNNLADDNSCRLSAPKGDLIGSNPQLLPLADNGGPTQTFAFADTSPAYNAGSTTGCPPSDQRSYGRPADGRCDIGAFELNGQIFQVFLPAIR
jgi:CSLREA domain-containing protein